MARFYMGLDLGQSNDYTALSILEKVRQPQNGEIVYHLRRLERVRGETYPNIVSKVVTMVRAEPLKHSYALVVDQTGVGRPIVDLFTQAGLNPVAISIHGGDSVTHEGSSYRIPKRDLVAVVKVLLQHGRLIGSNSLKLGSLLQDELLNFNYKLNPLTAHDSYGCWREGQHDDLVLSVALACWYGEESATQVTLTIPTRPMFSTYESNYHDLGGTWSNSPAAAAYYEAHRRRK